MWKKQLESLREGARELASDFAAEAREGVSSRQSCAEIDNTCTLSIERVCFFVQRRALVKQAKKARKQQALANPDDQALLPSWETGGFALEADDNSG